MTAERSVSKVDVGLSEKVAFLKRPEAYPEGTAAVSVKETHMSWVFLTDKFAYKMKKPVRTSFLDFSTCEARRINCEREIKLNQRLAEGIYLGTIALTVDARGRMNLTTVQEENGSAIDWLVKMCRLPAEHALDHAIVTGTLKKEDIYRLALRLALFFRAADAVPFDPGEYVHRFERDLLANRNHLLSPAYGLPAETISTVAEALEGFLSEGRPALAARARRVVEGHGDLRPEHIYLEDVPLVVDCLEFNRGLRLLDPVDELAYLAMECERIGGPRVERWLFDAFAQHADEGAVDDVILFYKCFRAFLRAKIAICHLDEPSPAAPQKWRKRTLQYLLLAQRYARQLS